MFNLLNPERDHTGQFCISYDEWCESKVFDIIIEIALKVKKDDHEAR